jgi:cohesin complex subunit SA-1/2
MQEYLTPEIISHFVMHGTSVAEIVKHLITIIKKNDDFPDIFLEALKRVWLVFYGWGNHFGSKMR